MPIKGLSRSAFERVLQTHLSPTTPIRSSESLKGRGKKLDDIRKAFMATGRHVFVYGDRGVGKTSLAQTAAYAHQSADGPPIILTCDQESSFYDIIASLVARCLGLDPAIKKHVSSSKVGGSIKIANFEVQKSQESGQIAPARSINEAIEQVVYAAVRHSQAPVVVIDEFERLTQRKDRALFADFIKQVGDQSVGIKLIFCGIGESLTDLLEEHHSCYRYLTSIKLDRLQWDGRLEIVKGIGEAAAVLIEPNTVFRICAISDGFPHYIHLICEKLLWEIYDDPKEVSTSEIKHFTGAVRKSVEDIEPRLRAIYDKATKKYQDDYQAVLWAVADHHELTRRSTDIYASYTRIIKERGAEPNRTQFNTRMNALKQPRHGEILKATRQGWYEFRENIMRGYVRLVAEQNGIELGSQHPMESRRF